MNVKETFSSFLFNGTIGQNKFSIAARDKAVSLDNFDGFRDGNDVINQNDMALPSTSFESYLKWSINILTTAMLWRLKNKTKKCTSKYSMAYYNFIFKVFVSIIIHPL